MARMAPIYIAPGDRTVTVFGGGNVALRKIRHFDGFRIRVVAREVLPEIEGLADEVVLCEIAPETVMREAPGSFIVMAATDSKQLNAMIRDTALEMGILVNSAHGGGDVLIPSTIRRKDYSVCVSSEGKVPAFPPYVADLIEPLLDESLDRMMELMIRIRPVVMDSIPQQKDRAKALYDILHDEGVWDAIRSGDPESAYEMAEKKVKA
ncbi:MAG: bifunctional precorrin-2 dehydrogenase/sirohydrochlorin ferrochelatase [Candidatus Methanomethylophilaceae archaeon]|nr:bifunctional precorrin-2 dehydrogenase/sirohydrochlorin ferrochelatase [Candidatus Methanomethylophilaceae archaeon]